LDQILFNERLFLTFCLENDEAAKADFQKAANLGGVFAKQMLISLNPYAALCNQMMAEMISKVKKGEMV